MNKQIIIIGSVFIFSLLVVQINAQDSTSAKTAPAESSVIENLLIRMAYPFEKTSDGDFGITIEFDDKRTQLVVISPYTSNLTNEEAYDIWSTVIYYQDSLPDSLVQQMLVECGDTYAGRFQSFPGDDEFLLAFSEIFYGDINQEILNTLINEVAELADLYEFKLSGKDDY